MKKIVLTGGGTAGHVTPNIALIPTLKEEGYDIHYIGSYNGIEKKLLEDLDIPYYGISSGKLRRYFDVKNFADPFRVIKGYSQACSLLRKIKPDVVFSKGGFVSVPVVLAAKHRRIPTIIHESDITPGLANKICIPGATKVCANFPETLKHLPAGKAELTGTPIRAELFTGNKQKGLDFCGFNNEKPVLLVIGGSLGSIAVNNAIRDYLTDILKDFQVIHLCGKGKKFDSLDGHKGYVQFEYIQKELCDLLSCADIVVSRAGANAICELLALNKPNILIPLSAASSRGDQILNAASFAKQGFSYVIQEEEIVGDTLLKAIHEVYENRQQYIDTMSQSGSKDSIKTIVRMINELATPASKDAVSDIASEPDNSNNNTATDNQETTDSNNSDNKNQEAIDGNKADNKN
ncbi:MAG: undecaprenyldiphospho-muramoylpentapeptide beta-N-acetylglucosaminyltransferase [Lachnospiraceae bacterium]|nr:undecaprenyldiphospho-muramoylpentapeptide beta-N-acetylglucosaminyltransferase [Lachnospiraceae bacterium]